MKKLIFSLAVVILSANYCLGQQSIDTSTSYPISIFQHAEILDLGQENIDLEDLLSRQEDFKFKKLTTPNENLGFTDHTYFVKFELKNEQNHPQKLFLETARPITDRADLFEVLDNQIISNQSNGDLIPFSERAFEHRKIIFPIALEAGESKAFYLKLQSDGEVINLPLNLYDDTALVLATYQDQLIFGVFYGLLVLAAITYLFFYFGIKERSFLLYSAYVVSVGLLHSSLDGYFFQYILQEPGWFADRSLLLFAALSALLFGRYTQAYIRMRSFSPLLNRIFNGVNVSILVLIAGVLIFDPGRPLYYPLVNALAFLLILLCLIGVAISYYKKQPADPFFTIGISMLMIGFVTFILNNFSLIENSFITENSAKLGTGIEILFLSLSMANRIRILRNEKEKAQNIALQQSEESNELKSFFLSNVSHELRTPLNAILGLSQSIMGEIKDQTIKENLEVIKYSSLSLLSSIDDILDYSKIEKGELVLEKRVFSTRKIIGELNALTFQQARDKKIAFVYEERAPLPEKLLGDANRFRQILGNVLNNAVKFTQEGEIKLQLSSVQENEHSIDLTFEIQDTGVGIKPEKLDRIYASFIQEQLDDKRKFGGFGLGLCIVKALVDLHQGKINVESTPQKGTRVSIQLALEKAPMDKLESIKRDADRILKGKNILVVEDNRVNQLVIKSILKKWDGVTFAFANHGIEALDRLNSENFDVVLMDLQMPEMDGYEATQAIRSGQGRKIHQGIPIIAVTADTTEISKNRVQAVGMDDYMNKPVDAELLKEKVAKALYLETIQLEKI
ncbi:hybrid sensor histidine kinase/response regulator [Algoriphagus hitonicola]|uniref:histidine kinase n=1 Tax=Algoriphagus hitonicola TaxID=435880 RepID=A0A1I2X976_9BACT|nr:hybrid sensor histidine kinase/response regulator [Algoriphagus hitonicola]SFH10074.1 Signal transduction histidine kinase [Algoriphagus hitonicola]